MLCRIEFTGASLLTTNIEKLYIFVRRCSADMHAFFTSGGAVHKITIGLFFKNNHQITMIFLF